MRKIFYSGLTGIALFEIAKVYFIMPMPGSQVMDTLDIAYFLHTFRTHFRILFATLIALGATNAFRTRHKWIPGLAFLAACFIVYNFNFKMTADRMFRQPQNLILKTKTGNVLGDSSLVMGVEFNGEVKAYPLRFIVYHHQVRDTVGGKPVMVTYCSVCRTGRVFEPRVGTEYETFRLVGMDHFNAMFEDASTKSWWRQVTGEAVAGPRKGESLPEIESFQLSVGQLFKLYPNALVMQPDESHEMQYDTLGKFEQGKSTGDLTRTDSLSWKEKSWVIGVQIGKKSKAYDWNLLTEQGIINDIVDDKPIVVAVTDDRQSFSVFERPGSEVEFSIRNDTLITKESLFDFSGQDLNDPYRSLDRVQAYQEFWHSWRTFHPYTDQFNEQQIVNNKQ